jgi:hypothetical protein
LDNVARLDSSRRGELFAETADRVRLSDTVVEKDFWVCWTLKQIFSTDALKNTLLFKGGTSLSKIFRAINRFSEDIDLAVDYAALGFVGARDPRQEGISRTKQNKILEEMLSACRLYIRNEFLPVLSERFQEVLGDRDWALTISPTDSHIVQFRYPPSVANRLAYISPQVVLELGTHAEFIPRDTFQFRSFVAEQFPQVFDEPEVSVTALLAKRTFWEKATILHAEYYRPVERGMPSRYSRHYYDLAMLAQSDTKPTALADLDLLATLVRHKQTSYASAWARYDLAAPGSLRLAPTADRLPTLRLDYRDMATMIFGEVPPCDSLIRQLVLLEAEINRNAPRSEGLPTKGGGLARSPTT